MLGIQTQVPLLVLRVLYPLSHLPSINSLACLKAPLHLNFWTLDISASNLIPFDGYLHTHLLYMTVQVYVMVHVCMCIQMPIYAQAIRNLKSTLVHNLSTQLFQGVSIFSFFLFWDSISHLNRLSPFSQAGSLAIVRNLPASTSPKLELQVHATMPGFLYRDQRSNSGPHACVVITLSTVWYLPALVWKFHCVLEFPRRLVKVDCESLPLTQ